MLDVKKKLKLKQDKKGGQEMTETSELLTVSEAAHLLRLKVSTIRAWVLHRRVPFVKLGGTRRHRDRATRKLRVATQTN